MGRKEGKFCGAVGQVHRTPSTAEHQLSAFRPCCCFQSHKPPNNSARAVFWRVLATPKKDGLCVVAHKRASEATCREEPQQYWKPYADSIFTQQRLILHPRYHSTQNANTTQHNQNASSKSTQILGRAPAAPRYCRKILRPER